MKKTWLVVIALLLVGSFSAFADNGCNAFDPLKRNLIFVEGASEIVVPVNNFEIRFGFDIQKGSFNEASREANRIFDLIEKGIKSLGLSDVEVIKGWDLLRQGKIAFGSKGKTISTKVTIRVKNCPKGKLHETIAQVIDKALATDSAVVLEGMNVFIEDQVEQEKKQEVIADALKKLNANATRVADSLGKKIVSPKRVYATSEAPATVSLESARWFSEDAATSSINIRKSFKVNAEIVDHMKISAAVTGLFEIN